MSNINVPDLGSDSAVEVIEIHVKPGDTVDSSSLVVTLESDKATMEIEAETQGTVDEVLVKTGDKVTTGAPLVRLSSEDKDASKSESPKENSQSTNGEETRTDSSKKTETVDECVPDIGTDDAVEVVDVAIKEGDKVEPEMTLITLESDKATMEIPATQSGQVKSVAIKQGDKVKTGDLILQLTSNKGAAEKEKTKQSSGSKSDKSKEVKKEPSKDSRQSESKMPSSKGFKGPSQSVHAGPAVRKMARMMKVDLAEVNGTGPKSRILKEDVEDFVANVMDARRSGSVGGGLPQVRKVDFAAFGPIEEVPLNKIKRITAKNMSAAWVNVPHVTQFDEADISDLDAFRKNLKVEAQEKGIKLTFMSFLLKATAKALTDWPRFNASLSQDGENLILKKYTHIGIAVDTPNGLVVPVVRDVDQKGVLALAEELMRISQKARDGKLMPQDMQGAGFTISSLGGIGGTQFTPIVNAPEVAILGVSRAKMQPVYMDGDFEARLMLPLALSYDHRVIDGAEAARFTQSLANYLEDYRRMIL